MDLFENLKIDSFDLDLRSFEAEDHIDMDFDFDFADDKQRYINPGNRKITSKPVKYRNAVSLAKKIGDIKKDDRYFIFLDGTFVFGDFIEAWIMRNDWYVKELTISTLSMSENNVDSLKNLFVWGRVDELNLIVSDYFFSHERHLLLPYLYKELDYENRFQLAAARVYTKICLIKTECGKDVIIHGSANLRTSGNVEQIVIECDQELFDYNYEWHHDIIEKFRTIKKPLQGRHLWQADLVSTKAQMQEEES